DDDVGISIALEVDDDAAAVLAAGMVVDVGDILDDALFDGFGDGFDDALADDAIGHLVDDDRGAAALFFLGVKFGADGHFAAAGFIAVDDSVAAADDPAGREIGALHPKSHDVAFGIHL